MTNVALRSQIALVLKEKMEREEKRMEQKAKY